MMDRHPDEDELAALALGALPGPQDELLRHLTDCSACRSAYDDVATGIDAVLPASPSVAAPPGFETQVLDRLRLPPAGPGRPKYRILVRRGSAVLRSHSASGYEHLSPGPDPASPGHIRDQRRPRRTLLLLAAAATAGICLGSAGVTVLHHDGTPVHVAPDDRGAPLVTASGTTVGTVEPSRAGKDRVVVMQITTGTPGAHYTCRLLLDDGSSRDAGSWWMPVSGQATWIAYTTAATVERVELTTDDGRIWSSAVLQH
ncbi:hypothetical protein [Streptomyces sp. NPDC046978]|uniref:hypothetical protein n=1 Tax=Streptomyces sp. NPDC046978 TaxID=3154704 RepID=UPI0033E10529